MVDPRRALPPEWVDIPDPLGPEGDRLEVRPPFVGIRSLTRAEVARRRAVALGLGLAWIVVSVAALQVRPGLAGHRGAVSAQAALWSVLGVCSLYAVLGRGGGRLGTPPWAAWFAAIGLPATYLGLAFLWVPGAGEPTYDLGPVGQLGACGLIGLSVAVPILCVAAWALRRSFVNAAGWRGAAIGVASGFGAATVLLLHCGISSSGHIAVGHGLPLVVAALVGAWFGARAGRA